MALPPDPLANATCSQDRSTPVPQTRSPETITLADGGVMLYDGVFLPQDLANRYFDELRDTSAWEQKKAAFGQMQPRLTASYGDEGVTYSYSGTENRALPWTPTLLEIKRAIEAVEGRYNYCLLNRYRSGADSVGMHADNEPGMGNVIGSLSLGAARAFRIKHNKSKETRAFELRNGTLLIMAGTMQQFWKHEVPKTTDDVGERINLTFRWIETLIPGRDRPQMNADRHG
jgi:alkylated DNA repair dioxygenase AlkB